MADDILLTPEQQDERARQWLKDNGPALLIGIGLGLAIVFGYNQYKQQQQIKAEKASLIYSQVLGLTEQSNIADIDKQVAQLKSEYGSTAYAAKAALLKAKQLVVSDLSAASDELQWALDHSPETSIQHVARLRLAKVYLAQQNIEQALSLAMHGDVEGFKSNYQELLGDIAVKQEKIVEAKQYYQTALENLSVSDVNYQAVLNLKINQLPSTGE